MSKRKRQQGRVKKHRKKHERVETRTIVIEEEVIEEETRSGEGGGPAAWLGSWLRVILVSILNLLRLDD